jgi:hypothetical protein
MQRLLAGEHRLHILTHPPAGWLTAAHSDVRPADSPSSMPLPYYGQSLLRLTDNTIVPLSNEDAITPSHVQFLHRTNAIDMFTQRGCTHECTFCAQDLLLTYKGSPRNTKRLHPSEIVSYLVSLRAQFPTKQFVYFWDLDFLRRPRTELQEFASLYRQHVALPFFIFVTEKTVNTCGEAVVRALVDAGIKTINMGIQSGSDRVLKEIYGRANTSEESKRATAILHSATRDNEIELLYDVITHNPQETVADIIDTINLVAAIPVDGRQIIRLNTHKLSFNTGQVLRHTFGKSTMIDYQDFIGSSETSLAPASAYLSNLLGKLMRGALTQTSIGSIQRASIGALIDPAFVGKMDSERAVLSTLLDAIVPQDSQPFMERWA